MRWDMVTFWGVADLTDLKSRSPMEDPIELINVTSPATG